jgi:hypothetical protein
LYLLSFRVFGLTWLPSGVATLKVSSRIGYAFRVLNSVSTVSWVHGPILPLVHSLGFMVFLNRAALNACLRHSEASSLRVHLRRVLPRSNLVQPAGPVELLSWTLFPYSTSGIEGPHNAGFGLPLRSVFRVWLPSGRFPPFESVSVLFRTDGALGIHPSELTPPERYPRVFTSDVPTCRFSHGWGRFWRLGSMSRGFWALTLSAVPGLPHAFNTWQTGCSLGFTLPGFARK